MSAKSFVDKLVRDSKEYDDEIVKLKTANAMLREALIDIEAGRGDSLHPGGTVCNIHALMRRAERALAHNDSEVKK